MSIAFQCERCGKQYEVSDELAARRARCSGCRAVFRVPHPVSTLGAPTEEEALLAALFEEEFGPASEDTKPCPSCSAPVAETAVLCIECGFHTESGKKIVVDRQEAEPAASIRPASAVSGAPAPKNPVSRTLTSERKRHSGFLLASYVRGTLMSLTFALVGGTLWAFASLATDYALGFLAWGVGSLAGLGMALGYQDDDGTLAGITSAGMALVGCVFSKVLYFALFLGAFLGMSNHELQHYGATIVAEDQLRATGKDPEKAGDDDYEQQYQLALQEIKTWDAEKIEQRIQLHQEADRIDLIDRLLTQRQPATRNTAADLTGYTKILQRVALLSDAEVVAELQNTPAVVVATTNEVEEKNRSEHAGFRGVTVMGLLLLGVLAFGIFGGVFLVLGVISAYRIGAGDLTA